MPRLRNKRDYDWTPSKEDFPDAYTVGEEQANTTTGQYVGYETDADDTYGTTGASWLSNAAVIASMSDDKLRSIIQRYKSILRLLETELHQRALGLREAPREKVPISSTETINKSRPTRRAVRTPRKTGKKVVSKQALDASQMLEALQLLEALCKAKSTKEDTNAK